MPRITATVSQEQYDHLEQRSEELDRSMSEVTSMLVQADMDSNVLHSDAPENDAQRSEVQQLRERLDRLEQRVSELEGTDSTHTELLEYVRHNGPCKAKELKEHCYPEDSDYARSTWWTKIAKDQLKESGASYKNNMGWRFE